MRRAMIITSLCLVIALDLSACKQAEIKRPPPNAQRPQIKSEQELAAERQERIQLGQVVPTSAPVVLGADRVTTPRSAVPPPVRANPGAIESDILMVNSSVVTVAEVLYPLRDEIEEIRKAQTAAGFRERMRKLLRDEAQRVIGATLIYKEATAGLGDPQKKALEATVDKEMGNIVAQDFGGSQVRLTAHLKEHGLTQEQLRAMTERDIVVRQYTREKFQPQIQIRRDELLSYYNRNIKNYETPERRELLLIELPFERFLSPGEHWDTASKGARAAAKVAALRRARDAHEALGAREFEDVAREYSLGAQASDGGSWGPITRPLQAPYDKLSGMIFGFTEGQYSEPVETETGVYIVQCGQIEPASRPSFAEVQDQLRRELMERRFNKLSAEYVIKLAENATISSLDLFVAAAIKRIETGTLSETARAGTQQ